MFEEPSDWLVEERNSRRKESPGPRPAGIRSQLLYTLIWAASG